MFNELLNKIPFDNIHKGWRTTLIGVLLLLASIVSVFIIEKVTWEDAILPIALGVMLIFSSDKKKPGPPNACVWIVALGFLLNSCVTYDRCSRKYNWRPYTQSSEVKNDSTLTSHTSESKDSVFISPADSIRPIIIYPCDSGKLKNVEIERKGVTGKALASVKKQGDALIIDCNCDKEKLIIKKQKETISSLVYKTSTAKNTTKAATERLVTVIPWYAKLRILIPVVTAAYIMGSMHVIQKLFKTAIKLLIHI